MEGYRRVQSLYVKVLSPDWEPSDEVWLDAHSLAEQTEVKAYDFY